MKRLGLLLWVLLCFPAQGARAQGLLLPHPIQPIRPVPIQPIRPVPIQPLTVKSQKVTMQWDSGALKVGVEQVFYNPNSFQMEGTYLFPLPEGAAVSNFRMTVDKEPVEGKMLTVEEARRIYESYVRRNIDPAILEYVGRNAFQARVFPIPPAGEKRIFLGYSQVTEFRGGLHRAVYPLNSDRVTGQPVGDLAIECTIRSPQALKAIYSPSHEVQVRREGEHAARLSYEGRDVRADRDFVVYYSTSEKAFGLNALAHRRVGEDGYVLMLLAPKREAQRGEVEPKDVVFVADTSGSMQGAKIEQARKAVQTVLDALNPEDRFNVIRFSSDVAQFATAVKPATRDNRAAARSFVDEFRAVGGTNIDEALQAGLASFPAPGERKGRGAYLLFMTDGLPTVGVTDIERILASASRAAPPDLRLFSFGVGADVNTLLLDRVSRDHHGAADYVDRNDDLETRIGDFYGKIANPVLSSVKVELEGAKLVDSFPSRLPDLFAGSQLLVVGRYQGQGRATVTLSGELNGKPQRHSYEISLPGREIGQEFIPRLWASRKIGFLLEELRLRGENKELKDEVIRLSKEYGIVTPYTAYLVEEPGLTPLPRLGVTPLFRDRQDLSGPAGPTGSMPAPRGGFGGGGLGGGGFGGAATRPAAPSPAQERARREALAQQQGFGRSTGQDAVDVSRRVRALQDRAQDEKEVEVSRSVQGRAFRLEKGIWRDATIPSKATSVAIKYGSEAYFQLVRARPEWARYLALGKALSFRSGSNTVVTVGETGKEKLTAAELAALER